MCYQANSWLNLALKRVFLKRTCYLFCLVFSGKACYKKYMTNRLKTKLPAVLAVLLALTFTLAACDNGTTSGGNDYSLKGETVRGNSLAEKLAWLEENAVSGGSYIIEIDADETIEPVMFLGRATPEAASP